MSFNYMLEKLKLNYLKDLNVKVNKLTGFIGHIESKSEEIQTFYHQLKGSGATYGVPEISEIGKKFEDKTKDKSLTDSDIEESKIKLEEVLKAHLG